MKKTKKKKMNLVDRVIAFEDGELSQEEVLELFSELLKTGVIYGFQGRYHREVAMFIDSGLLDINGNILNEY